MARRGITPNAISLSGLVAAVLAGAALAATPHAPSYERMLWIAAACLIQLRLLANLMDGLVAVEGGLGTPTGELFNEIPDRLSDATVLIGLGYATGGEPLLGYAAALVALFTAYVRAQSAAAGAPNDFRGPFAKQQRMAVVTAAALIMGLAPAAWRPAFGLASIALVLVLAGTALTAWLRLRGAARALREAAE